MSECKHQFHSDGVWSSVIILLNNDNVKCEMCGREWFTKGDKG